MDVDAVFKALADRSRRELLDRLNADNGQRLVELCEGLHMTRQAVSRHLAVLEAANLVTTVKRGRDKLHYLNPVPINEIADRWIGRYDRGRVAALADLKHALEDKPVPKPEFVYTTYIRSTPEQVWQALTEPAFTVRYWGEALKSDWKIGSPVLYKTHGSDEYRDLGEVVLEYAPYRRLAYTWHNYQPEHKAIYGWTDEQFAELVKEPQSKVAFELETHGDETVKLTVIHDGFETETEMLKGVSQGWPQILASLKSLLESGEPLTWPEWEHLREATSRSS